MIRINLLPPEAIKKEERLEVLFVSYGVAILIMIIALVRYSFLLVAYNNLNREIEITQAELTQYESIVQQVEALQATKAVLETKKNVIKSLMAGRLTYPMFMETVMQLLPANIWINSINTELKENAGMTVSIEAEALDNYSIADFVQALLDNPNFSGVELGPLSSSGTEKMPTSVFRITFIYNRVGGGK